MTALDHRTHAIDAEVRTVAAVTRVTNGLRSFFRAVLNRREVNRLADMSDYQLADIGLKRSDLLVVMHSPLGTDPTTKLSDVARERYAVEFGARRVC